MEEDGAVDKNKVLLSDGALIIIDNTLGRDSSSPPPPPPQLH